MHSNGLQQTLSSNSPTALGGYGPSHDALKSFFGYLIPDLNLSEVTTRLVDTLFVRILCP